VEDQITITTQVSALLTAKAMTRTAGITRIMARRFELAEQSPNNIATAHGGGRLSAPSASNPHLANTSDSLGAAPMQSHCGHANYSKGIHHRRYRPQSETLLGPWCPAQIWPFTRKRTSEHLFHEGVS